MRFLAFIGAVALIAAFAAGIYFFGGFYNVAATAEDPAIVDWALARVRAVSIDRHATDRPSINLDDAATVQAGARAYAERGCVNCHGAPGVNWAKWSEGITPYPPNLKELVDAREPRQLFWVVKNGIRMTAMPGFAKIEAPDDELWRIVAFLKKLPTVSEGDYKDWTAPASPPQ
jgi:mono/diheme cytochrome c family protein